MKKILFIGGGTGGHILPLLNLIEKCLEKNAKISFILAEQKLDREIFKKNFKNLDIKPIFLKTGKIRRYFSWQNFKDFFRIFGAIFQARKILKTEKPDVIFFKGGFVCFPVLIASKFLFPKFKGKIYLHESDSTISNLGKFISKFTDKTFSNFGSSPLRLFYSLPHTKNRTKKSLLPHIFIFGGSQGAVFINQLINQNAQKLCRKYKITLICGKNKRINFIHQNFEQYELLSANNFANKLNSTDLVISRGSASLFQILSLKKPSIIIPLPSSARNHQYLNTQYFEKKGLVKMLEQNEKSSQKLILLIEETLSNQELKKSLKQTKIENNANKIADIILN